MTILMLIEMVLVAIWEMNFWCLKLFYILLNIKYSWVRLVLVGKGSLKLPNLHMPIKQKSPSHPRNLVLRTSGELLIVFSTKVNLLYLLNIPLLCYTFTKNFSKNSYLDDSDISLRGFLSRTNLKLHNISVTPKMVKKVVTNLHSQRHLVLILFQWWF